jgi:hypothetical protein
VHSICDEASCTTPLLLGLVHCLPATSFSDGELHVVFIGQIHLTITIQSTKMERCFLSCSSEQYLCNGFSSGDGEQSGGGAKIVVLALGILYGTELGSISSSTQL